MSVYVTAYVWEHSSHAGTELLLLIAIADIANKEGVAWPSVPKLARSIRMSDRNTQRVLARLEASGELKIRKSAGPKGTHLYQVQMNETLPLFNHAEGGDKLSPDKLTGDTQGPRGVTPRAQSGDIAMSTEPLGTNYRTTAKAVDKSTKSKAESPHVQQMRKDMEKRARQRQGAKPQPEVTA